MPPSPRRDTLGFDVAHCASYERRHRKLRAHGVMFSTHFSVRTAVCLWPRAYVFHNYVVWQSSSTFMHGEMHFHIMEVITVRARRFNTRYGTSISRGRRIACRGAGIGQSQNLLVINHLRKAACAFYAGRIDSACAGKGCLYVL